MRYPACVMLAVGALTLTGCMSSVIPSPSDGIKVYVMSLPTETLKGYAIGDDLDLKACETVPCHVFLPSGYTSLRKYIVDIEESLRACQSK